MQWHYCWIKGERSFSHVGPRFVFWVWIRNVLWRVFFWQVPKFWINQESKRTVGSWMQPARTVSEGVKVSIYIFWKLYIQLPQFCPANQHLPSHSHAAINMHYDSRIFYCVPFTTLLLLRNKTSSSSSSTEKKKRKNCNNRAKTSRLLSFCWFIATKL